MLSSVIDLFSGGGVLNAVGAISGLVGGWLAKREQRKMLTINNAHEVAMGEIDFKNAQAERAHAIIVADKKIQHAQVEGEIAIDVRDADAFVESMSHQGKSTGSKIGDTIKSAVRPVLTGVLLWMSYDIYTQLDDLLGGLTNLDKIVIQQLYVYVVHSIIFLTITAVAWWFASRGEKAIAAIKGMMK